MILILGIKKGSEVPSRIKGKRKFRKLEKDYVKHLSHNIDMEDTYSDLEEGLDDFEKFHKPKRKKG